MHDHGPNLSNLVRLGVRSVTLEIELGGYARTNEHMVASAGSLLEAEISQQSAEVVEADIRVRPTMKDALQEFFPLRHLRILAASPWKRACPPPIPHGVVEGRLETGGFS